MQREEQQGFSANDLDLLEALLAQDAGTVRQKIPRADRNGLLPVSFAQQRLWFAYHLANSTAAYHVPLVARLTGPLSVSRLQMCIDEIIRRHETLRTTFQ